MQSGRSEGTFRKSGRREALNGRARARSACASALVRLQSLHKIVDNFGRFKEFKLAAYRRSHFHCMMLFGTGSNEVD